MIVSISCSLSALPSLMRTVLNESMSAKSFGIRAESTTRDVPGADVSGTVGCRFSDRGWVGAMTGRGFAQK